MVTAVRAESEKLAALSKHLDAKRKNLADEMQREMSKRLKLEDNITRRLFSTGEYKLEGRDVKVVPNGVACVRLEHMATNDAKLAARLENMTKSQLSQQANIRSLKSDLAHKKDEFESLECAAESQRKLAERTARVALNAAKHSALSTETRSANLGARLEAMTYSHQSQQGKIRILKSELTHKQDELVFLECTAESQKKFTDRNSRVSEKAAKQAALSRERISTNLKARLEAMTNLQQSLQAKTRILKSDLEQKKDELESQRKLTERKARVAENATKHSATSKIKVNLERNARDNAENKLEKLRTRVKLVHQRERRAGVSVTEMAADKHVKMARSQGTGVRA